MTNALLCDLCGTLRLRVKKSLFSSASVNSVGARWALWLKSAVHQVTKFWAKGFSWMAVTMRMGLGCGLGTNFSSRQLRCSAPTASCFSEKAPSAAGENPCSAAIRTTELHGLSSRPNKVRPGQTKIQNLPHRFKATRNSDRQRRVT